MYVWQMHDGTWRISLLTNQRHKFTAIFQNKPALALYERAYHTRRDAETAERTIRETITGVQ